MLRLFLRKLIRQGHLAVEMPDGRAEWFGNAQGELVAVRIVNHTAALKLAFHPDLYLGECYMDGSLAMPAVENKSIAA